MKFLDSIGKGIKGYFDKNAEQQRMMDELQKEADNQRLIAFREQFAIDSKEVALAQAKKESAEKSGLQKLRATNRSRRLNESGPEPGTFYEKLSNFTKNNKARMQQNLERTKVMREAAEKMKAERMAQKQSTRTGNLQKTQTLGNRRPTWKM